MVLNPQHFTQVLALTDINSRQCNRDIRLFSNYLYYPHHFHHANLLPYYFVTRVSKDTFLNLIHNGKLKVRYGFISSSKFKSGDK